LSPWSTTTLHPQVPQNEQNHGSTDPSHLMVVVDSIPEVAPHPYRHASTAVGGKKPKNLDQHGGGGTANKSNGGRSI
jgi:hypothetical protein